MNFLSSFLAADSNGEMREVRAAGGGVERGEATERRGVPLSSLSTTMSAASAAGVDGVLVQGNAGSMDGDGMRGGAWQAAAAEQRAGRRQAEEVAGGGGQEFLEMGREGGGDKATGMGVSDGEKETRDGVERHGMGSNVHDSDVDEEEDESSMLLKPSHWWLTHAPMPLSHLQKLLLLLEPKQQQAPGLGQSLGLGLGLHLGIGARMREVVGEWVGGSEKRRGWLLPALAVLQWWFFNVLLILLNKWIFQVYQFNFPLTLTALHFGVSFIGAFICIRVLNLKPLAKVTRMDLLVRVLPMAIVTNLNVCLGNVSLRWIPVTFMQTVKAFTPATTVLLQRVVQNRHFDPRIYLSLIPIVGGVTIASATELSFHLLGFTAALTSTVFTSVNSILAEVLLKGHVDMDSINTVYYMAPQDFAMLAPLAIIFEFPDLMRWYFNSYYRQQALIAVMISAVLAFGLNFSLFYAIQATSAMTFNVSGNLKVALAMVLGWLIYRNPMSIFSSLGCAITVLGCMWYGYIQHKVNQEKRQALLNFEDGNRSNGSLESTKV